MKLKDPFIPQQFQEGQPIEQLLLICDVDGVIRKGVDVSADLRIIQAIRSLLENEGVAVAFLSGTPMDNDVALESWREGQIPLNQVIVPLFKRELHADRVTIYGALGTHRMKRDGSLEIMDEYTPEISFELGSLLIRAFLREVLHAGNPEQQTVAQRLQRQLEALKWEGAHASSRVVARELHPLVYAIRDSLDADFRLVSNGALIETHTSNPPWQASLGLRWLMEEMEQPHYLTSRLPACQKQIVSGVARMGDQGFNFLLISKLDKGITAKRYLQEKSVEFPKALIVTIGDTQLDFPMHKCAHLAFHVGLEEVWSDHALPQCIMMRNRQGKDRQYVEGTLQVLHSLKEAIGRSFYDLKYIPRCNFAGECEYLSINEISVTKE